VKRGPNHAWPRDIVEVPALNRRDSRVDQLATQKISKELLEEALSRTKSGTRAVVRSEPFLERADDSVPPDSGRPTVLDATAAAFHDGLEAAPVNGVDDQRFGRHVLGTQRILTGPSAPHATGSSAPSAGGPSVTGAPSPYSTAPQPVAKGRPLWLSPSGLFLVAVLVGVGLTLAAVVGFLAGRGLPHFR
jgi:hypothetical protein